MSSVELPIACDVLVVGAGPSGAACALWLAQAGIDCVLVDQHDFPRDKTCGDGLIPDAHHALRRLGVHDEVMAAARHARHVACIGSRGGRVDVPGTLAVLPRRILDDIVCRAAVRAGARLHTPWRFEAPLQDGDLVVGARLKRGDEVRELRARWVVLATGAVPQALLAAGMCERRTPTGIALRGYVRNEAMVDRLRALEVVWHKSLTPGYGWIFPAPGGRFNIGVGLCHSHPSDDSGRNPMKDINLRRVFDAFIHHYEPARELLRTGTLEGELKGAPLRCTLEGARLSRPGLLVTGEAAGSTYSFTGEGIGKAYETGLLAAEALLAGRTAAGIAPGTADAVRTRYEAAVHELRPRFRLYEEANKVNRHPWLADLIIWRARGSEKIIRKMAGVLDETTSPSSLVSMRGLAKVMMPWLIR